jgi:hypothetical protein
MFFMVVVHMYVTEDILSVRIIKRMLMVQDEDQLVHGDGEHAAHLLHQ